MKQLLDIKEFTAKHDRLPTCEDCVFFDPMDKCAGDCKRNPPIIFEKMVNIGDNGCIDLRAMIPLQVYPILYIGDRCAHGLFRDGWE